MILECKSCSKKFLVPDSAITANGRLVQCSSCGNKWTQFPVKNTNKIKTEKIPRSIKNISSIKPTIKKSKKIKKRTGPSIYSKEYLEKKHGIKLGNQIHSKPNRTISNKQDFQIFGFYSYLLLTLFFIVSFLGVLNLTKEIVIDVFPFSKEYIQYLFENLNNLVVILIDMFNVY